MITTAGKQEELVARATPFVQGLYKALTESEGLSTSDAKNVIQLALECAILNEMSEGGTDR